MKNDGGYAGKILRVDLSTGRISHLPTSDYADRFLGGRGIAAKLYWDLVPPEARALGPENALIFVTGPLAGVTGLSGSRWQVCAKSPITSPEQFCYANCGGHWGGHLKLAGYDGLIVEGASEKPVYLVIRDDRVEIRDAAHLWQKGALAVRQMIKGELGRDVRVVASGPAGDNLVRFANLLADGDASGSSGGAVMGSKKLKAIVVRGTGRVPIANPEKLRNLLEHVRATRSLMSRTAGEMERTGRTGDNFKRSACLGCPGCPERLIYRAADGTQGKFVCHGTIFYTVRAQRYYGRQTEVPFFANRLCDDYGLDTMPVGTMLMWLNRCVRAGILNDENTGLPLSKLGSLEFMETLVKKIAFREGFGDLLAHGPTAAAALLGRGTPELITDYIVGAEQPAVYDPRLYITTGIFYAMEPRQPMQQLHEISLVIERWLHCQSGEKDAYVTSEVVRRIGERFWGSALAADFSTYEGKALAARKIQDRQYAKESLILCDWEWPKLCSDSAPDHLGDPTIESRLYSAVTGRETDEAGLYRLGERVFNLQRAVLAREGRLGREGDRLKEALFTVPLKPDERQPECLVPGKNGEPFSRKGAVVDRVQFERMKTEYYHLRGWDAATGLQTRSKLSELGLDDIAADLAKRRAVSDPAE